MYDSTIRYSGEERHIVVFLKFCKDTQFEELKSFFELSYNAMLKQKKFLRVFLRASPHKLSFKTTYTDNIDGSVNISVDTHTIQVILYILDPDMVYEYAHTYKRGEMIDEARLLIEYFEIEDKYPEYFI